MLLNRDSIYYFYEGSIDWENIINQNEEYLSIIYKTTNDVVNVNIEWMDSIRVKDKIVAKNKKQLKLLVYESSKTICIFSSSESHIAFAIAQLNNYFQISIQKVKLFELYQNFFIKSLVKNTFKLTSLDIFRASAESFINISVQEIKQHELLTVLTNQTKALVILHEDKDIYFVIDSNSIVSFFDTEESLGIYDVCKRIVKDIV
ncbi:hypothetical protein ACIQYS_15850 [Psychrobacillus sp. NPDC096426]|uniref:hypothetical protein n=1 Tax=Psychrobacillus sp. NPDC096426 TaxID=3364491 RepID=UPI00381CACE9